MPLLETDLVTLAQSRSGLFTTRDAGMFGLSPQMAHRAVSQGECRTVLRGVHSTAIETPTREARLAELTKAMLLSNEHAAATGRSAAVLYGLPLHSVAFQRAQGVWTNDNATRSTSHLIIRRPLVAPTTSEVGGWLAVDPPWALVDLARDAGVVPGIVAMDAALHLGLTTRDAVWRVIDELRAAHRLERARQMADRSHGARESAGESRLGPILEDAGLAVEVQFELRRYWSGRRAYADFRIKGTRVLVEFDGMVKYRGDQGATALAEEKRREDELRRQGWVFVRVVWRDLDDPPAIIARVREAIALAESVVAIPTVSSPRKTATRAFDPEYSRSNARVADNPH